MLLLRKFCCLQVFENLIELQKDVSISVQEVTKMQKVYKEEEHVAHDARIKAAEADDKYAYLFLIVTPFHWH